jgi:TIR domain
VDKVFEEGLKDAAAMVVVLSANSIDKPWVREEINAGFMKRIEGKCKLIPVVLDGVEVPEVLRSTVWQRIDDLDSYDEAFDRVLRAIHDDRHRPAAGAQPRYAQRSCAFGPLPECLSGTISVSPHLAMGGGRRGAERSMR